MVTYVTALREMINTKFQIMIIFEGWKGIGLGKNNEGFKNICNHF